MRLFFALWPPRATAEALHAWAERAQRATGGRVVAAPNIHLTLAFLGEVAAPRVAGLEALAAGGESHSLAIEQARYWARNRIVWAGPNRPPGAMRSTVRRLAGLLQAGGFSIEERPFAAHVTLIRKAGAPEALPELPMVSWPVTEFVLVRSQLSPAGSSYETVKRYPLA